MIHKPLNVVPIMHICFLDVWWTLTRNGVIKSSLNISKNIHKDTKWYKIAYVPILAYFHHFCPQNLLFNILDTPHRRQISVKSYTYQPCLSN